MMDVTRRQMTNSEPGKQVGSGPANAFTHVRAFPPIEFKAVPWANFDTLYSLAWLDLTAEPLILSVPDTGGRYYLMPLQDMWTDVFAVPGKRTSGTGAGHFAVVPPRWQGELPADAGRIDAPTPYAWVIARTQANGPGDYPAVRRAQDGFAITPYFAYAAELLKLHPPHVTDWSILARMKRTGLEPGSSFDVESLDPAVRHAVEQAVPAGLQALQAKVPRLVPLVNGWQVSADTMGVYGNFYLKRATLALVGLGSNPPEDTIYPLAFTDGEGKPLTGESNYVLHFDAQELPRRRPSGRSPRMTRRASRSLTP